MSVMATAADDGAAWFLVSGEEFLGFGGESYVVMLRRFSPPAR